jgi:hypothetical protein
MAPGTIFGEKNEGRNLKFFDTGAEGRLDDVSAIDIVNPLSS